MLIKTFSEDSVIIPLDFERIYFYAVLQRIKGR